jgi:hypothetical protein
MVWEVLVVSVVAAREPMAAAPEKAEPREQAAAEEARVVVERREREGTVGPSSAR